MKNLQTMGLMPYYVGNTWHPRFRVRLRDTLGAVDFTNALITFIIKNDFKDTDAVALFTKSSSDDGITIDDQTTEPTIPATNTTGRGWFALNMDPSDQAALLPVALEEQTRYYEIRALMGDGTQLTLFQGTIELNIPLVRAIV